MRLCLAIIMLPPVIIVWPYWSLPKYIYLIAYKISLLSTRAGCAGTVTRAFSSLSQSSYVGGKYNRMTILVTSLSCFSGPLLHSTLRLQWIQLLFITFTIQKCCKYTLSYIFHPTFRKLAKNAPVAEHQQVWPADVG